MARVRFRVRTLMIAIVLAAVVMGILRFVLLIGDFFGFEFVYYAVTIFSVFVIFPVVTIVEVLFFAGYLWFRRKEARRMFAIGEAEAPSLKGGSDTTNEPRDQWRP
jgi:hypothetical protein